MAINFEIVLHGVPYGHNVTKSTLLNSNYFDIFYNGGKSGEAFYMDAKVSKGCTAYTFCLYPDKSSGQVFCDENGRPGSYVGLSLIVDSGFQFPDTNWALKQIRECYYKYIHNQLVKKPAVGNNLVWARNASKFFQSSELAQIIANMEKQINNNYTQTFLKPSRQNQTASQETGGNVQSKVAQMEAAREKLQSEIADLETQLEAKRQQLVKLQQNLEKE